MTDPKKPSRPVTRKRKCRVCGYKFKPTRADARYCSPGCRQRAHRARAGIDDLDREIEAARLHFWQLVYDKAVAKGCDVSQVVTDIAQYIDHDGNVYEGGLPGRGGRLVGRSGKPFRPG
jgi:hypothetical protein